MDKTLFSIRMRAACAARHISGAERLSEAGRLEALAAEMVRRALQHDKGRPDQVVLTIDKIEASDIVRQGLPDIRTVQVESVREGRAAALSMLARAGVSSRAAVGAMEILTRGAAPDGASMRGAMLVDAVSGRRIEKDCHRGIRVTRMDIEDSAETRLRQLLQTGGIDNLHVREALVLATKVMHGPGVLAELCWSDDPGYTAGYVAARGLGYVRFPLLKPLGEERGGRAFFVAPDADLARLIHYLENQVVLIDQVGRILPDERWSA